MSSPDFERASEYVYVRLQNELAPKLSYHNFAHTLHDVLPAVTRLGTMAGLPVSDLLVLRTAALFHDIGFIEQYVDHESVSARIAAEQLPHFGYSPVQIQQIVRLISITKLTETPANLLEKLIRDADLDVLGRDNFLPRSYDLLAETNIYGMPLTKPEWHLKQLQFLEWHTYYTDVAKKLRNEGKRCNIDNLRQLCAATDNISDHPCER